MILAALLAAGCSPSRTVAPADDLATEKTLASQLAFDVTQVRKGDWVLYTVKLLGQAKTDYYKWAAVEEEGAAIWIENKYPAPPNPAPLVMKIKVERATGKVLEIWRGEPGGIPGKTYPSPRSVEEPKPRRDSSASQPQTREEPDVIQVGGKTFRCTRVTTTLSYPDGRKSTLTNWFSKDVPFPASAALGGLVRRQFGRLTMEILDSGTGMARPELEIPK
jgi:hypothetical protein